MSTRICYTLAALLAISCGAHAAARHIPLNDFIRHDQISKPRLSPDGKYLVMTVKLPQGEREVPTMTIYALPDMKIVGAVRLPAYEVPLNYTWVSNTRLVVTKGTERGDLIAPMNTGEVLAMNFDGSKQEYLYGYDNYKYSSQGARLGDDYGWGRIAGMPLPRNGHVYLNSELYRTDRSQLYDVNSVNSVRRLMADIGQRHLTFVQQSDQTPRFAWGIDDDTKYVLYRHDDAADTWQRIKDPANGHEFRPFKFAADDSNFLAFYSARGGPEVLVRQQVASGLRTVLAQAAVGDIDELVRDAHGMPVAAGSLIGIPQVRVFDPGNPTAKLYQALRAQFPGQLLSFINFTEDGAKLLFEVRSDRDPGSYYLYDRASNKAEFLFAAAPQLDPAEMAERRPIQFSTRDGVTLYGYMTLPANPDQRKLPMVVLPHGGPHGIADKWDFDSEAQFLASRGYAVLQVNYRGSGGRGDAFVQAGYRQWGDKIMDDIIDGVRWSIAQGQIDGDRICTYGASFGGYAALELPIRAPGMFRCAIGYAGVYELPLMFEEERTAGDKKNTKYFTDFISADPVELARISPSRHAAQVNVPVLLVHGTNDKIAQVENATIMRTALIRAGNAPEWLLADGEGHGFYDTKNVTAFYQKMEAFLAKYIGDPAQVAAADADRAVH